MRRVNRLIKVSNSEALFHGAKVLHQQAESWRGAFTQSCTVTNSVQNWSGGHNQYWWHSYCLNNIRPWIIRSITLLSHSSFIFVFFFHLFLHVGVQSLRFSLYAAITSATLYIWLLNTLNLWLYWFLFYVLLFLPCSFKAELCITIAKYPLSKALL